MPGNSWASDGARMHPLRRRVSIAVLGILCTAFAAFGAPGAAASWYESDGAGIAYRSIAETYASRVEWALRIEESRDKIDGVESARVETRTLYQKGEERRRTVSALDDRGGTVYSRTVDSDGRERIERYDPRHRMVEERILGSDGSGSLIKYEWNGDRLLRASSYGLSPEGIAEEPEWTDSYVYLRDGALRSVTRTPDSTRFVQDTRLAVPRSLETKSADGGAALTRFDPSGRVVETVRVDGDGNAEPVVETVAYGEDGKNAGPSISHRGEGSATIETERDVSGHVVRETKVASDGSVVYENLSAWEGDRVKSVSTRTGQTRTRTDYSYDGKGNRILEKNYRNGILERVVRRDGESEVEELYKNGKIVLRAYYEGGKRVREETPR